MKPTKATTWTVGCTFCLILRFYPGITSIQQLHKELRRLGWKRNMKTPGWICATCVEGLIKDGGW